MCSQTPSGTTGTAVDPDLSPQFVRPMVLEMSPPLERIKTPSVNQPGDRPVRVWLVSTV
jgi:hypothetical protein